MKNLNKFLISLSLVLTSTLLPLKADAFDQLITVKFKSAPSAKFIQDLNKMTNTTVARLEPPATYVLKVSGIANKDTMDRYSELFSIMQNVTDVSPVPKEKLDDKINPHFYMNNSVQNNQVSRPADPGAGTVQESRLIEDELIVKFYNNIPEEDMQIINNSVGGELTYIPESQTYSVKLPEHIDPETAISIYENSGRVELVEQKKVTVTENSGQTQGSGEQAPGTLNSSQSGVITSFPLAKRDIKVTFKIGEEQAAMSWFNEVFGTKFVSKKGFSSYILRFPENVNVKMVARALKVCSSVSGVEVSTD